ncbi:MAG: hypothetical protein RIA65_18530 [Woeseia sp.]
MNSKLGTIVSTVLMLAGITLWSVSVLAADNVSSLSASASQKDTRELAADANRAAANDAVIRIGAANRLDLDIELIGRTAVKIAGN